MDKEQIFQYLAESWNKNMPFNQLLGFEITRFDDKQAEISFRWDDKLIGNPIQKILHGGVTAAVLDVAGGVVAAANVIANLDEITPESVQENIRKLGTIDLRTDFLRPGRGEHFVATAHIIRSGSKVAVARMELHNENGDHIAFGTGTYMVG
ncbi:thioesterase family protein [Thalassotalea sp. M1531]|uniref:Medium/long-chain acyl-CoA thioesterase YigI n=1 Tax=Thalassotalea algicola TaxID=2716224 RepID=A0A7Y0Q556_9GAMM|nr:thioesterase family protein [Thalassotalea algicola]NMP30709.1 thioesterase family protein [Thalassotalea algicola]